MAGQEMTKEQLLAEIERLTKVNAEIQAKKESGITLKITEKGGLSLYGMGRFPVTLYKKQWKKLLSHHEQISKFIEENEAKLTDKQDAAVAKVG